MTAPTMGTQDIDRFLAAAVEAGEIPGVCALAFTRGRARYIGSFGERADGAPWSVDTVAWLGSMTKMIVAIGALQLVEQGRLDLDADLAAVLPALAEPKVLTGFDDAGRPQVRPAVGAVTLRRLLSHTAGNGYHFWNADVLRYQEVAGLPGIIECRDATLTTPLLFDPGTAWEYGMNIDWVGKAIEAVTGQDLEQYLRGSLLDPLGMSSTSFRLGPAMRDELATMNFRTPDGLVGIEFEMTQEPEFLMAGGAMYGSPADYLTLLRMLLGGGEVDGVRVLREDTVNEAMSNQIGDLTIGKITTVDPGSSNDVEFLPGTTKKWSLLGMLNVEETLGGRSAGSLFWAGLPNAYFWVDRDRGDAGVLFTQILPFGDHAVLDLFDRFENAVRAL
ncbi:serine hydrolase domain-containing protein [Lentzea sp. NPDC051213]|uniref:serine hydrolase domain-containing protein n=1 Tax=Lentzea sp. NPDC051213 TaxID=3364126 RepID=UPI0037B0AF39